MRDVLIDLFEKPLTKERETERKVLTQILCNSDLIQVGVNVPVFLCHSSKKEPSESVRAAGRFSPAAPACPTFVYTFEQRDHFVFR